MRSVGAGFEIFAQRSRYVRLRGNQHVFLQMAVGQRGFWTILNLFFLGKSGASVSQDLEASRIQRVEDRARLAVRVLRFFFWVTANKS